MAQWETLEHGLTPWETHKLAFEKEMLSKSEVLDGLQFYNSKIKYLYQIPLIKN